MPTRHTPYHQRFVELGAEMGDRIGFDAAVVFTSTQEEHMATREGVGLYDVYYQGPIDIKGPDAQALLDHVLARDVPRRMATDGQVLYSSVCNESGGMIDDLTAYRLGPEHYWVIATPARAETIERYVTGARARASRLRDELHLRHGVPVGAGARLTGAARAAHGRGSVRREPPVLPIGADVGGGRAGAGLAHRVLRRARLRALLPA